MSLRGILRLLVVICVFSIVAETPNVVGSPASVEPIKEKQVQSPPGTSQTCSSRSQSRLKGHDVQLAALRPNLRAKDIEICLMQLGMTKFQILERAGEPKIDKYPIWCFYNPFAGEDAVLCKFGVSGRVTLIRGGWLRVHTLGLEVKRGLSIENARIIDLALGKPDEVASFGRRWKFRDVWLTAETNGFTLTDPVVDEGRNAEL